MAKTKAPNERIDNRNKSLDWHMSVPYRIVITTQQIGPNTQYRADSPELPGCPTGISMQSWEDATAQELTIRRGWLNGYVQRNEPPPLPDVCGPP